MAKTSRHFEGSPNINHLWAALLVEELVRCGVRYFCIAPGSRSSPLTVAAAENPGVKTFVHFDERGLAFHALGYASATQLPVVLICTSGTATANFLPAVIEASKKKIPLVVLTADRPPELRQTGAMQTIEQPGIFGPYVRFNFDVPCPDPVIKAEMVLTTVDQAVYRAQGRPAGPVHLNCMFREPLAPVKSRRSWQRYLSGLKRWMNTAAPYTTYVRDFESVRIAATKPLAERINRIKNGIIAVGKIRSGYEQTCAVQLAQKLGWPLLPDISSGLRLGNRAEGTIHYFDQFLASSQARRFRIDGVIHLGGRMTSKRFYDFIEAQAPQEYITVLNHPLRNDPLHRVTLRVETTVTNFCDTLLPLIKPRPVSAMCSTWQTFNSRAERVIGKICSGRVLTEPAVARLVSQAIPEGHGLFLANSMPIRDMDMFADHRGHSVSVNGNRGASGIDGLVASAAGYAVGLQKPVTLMIGDLALLYDLNSLAQLKNGRPPVVMVVLNNNGGGIFSFLPIAGFSHVFEPYFGTPHGATFAPAAKMFSLHYACPKTPATFRSAYRKALQQGRSTIIEVRTGRGDNLRRHRQLQDAVRSAVERGRS